MHTITTKVDGCCIGIYNKLISVVEFVILDQSLDYIPVILIYKIVNLTSDYCVF